MEIVDLESSVRQLANAVENTALAQVQESENVASLVDQVAKLAQLYASLHERVKRLETLLERRNA